MNDAAWHAFLDTLTPDQLHVAQSIMARVNTVLNADRQKHIADLQRTERRSDRNAERINELDIRLDQYETQRAIDTQVELERIKREVISKEEADQMLTLLYGLAVRVEQLESKRQIGKP